MRNEYEMKCKKMLRIKGGGLILYQFAQGSKKDDVITESLLNTIMSCMPKPLINSLDQVMD